MNPNNPLNLPETLPIVRYRFAFQLQDDLYLPPYAGSTLRGVLGHALRRTACMTRQKDCHGCPLLQTCPYSTIFATPSNTLLNKSQQSSPPQPYIIEACSDGIRYYAADSLYHFDLVLVGQARFQLPMIAYAFNQAFERGITQQRSRGRLENIAVETQNGQWQNIYQDQRIIPHTNHITLPQSYVDHTEITFHTPLRIQQHNSVLGIERINADIMLRQLLRRISTMALLHWQKIDADFNRLIRQTEQVSEFRCLQWQDWTRYSNRQQKEMTLGGLIGTWQLNQLPLEYAQLLHIGQWLHIGKETVFGHGRYSVKES